jgi:predicted ArsR family transcriptional regulator
MSKDLKLSVSTIRRAIRDLTAENLIETKQRYRQDGGKSSLTYTIKKE